MADVARLAGVSHQTVSRVLNDQPNVRQQTRELVLAAISKLAYRPNAAARTLVTRRTHTLGVISCVTDASLYGPASMLYGIERAASGSYFVSVVSLPTLDQGSVLDAADRLLRQGVEGIIVIAPRTSAVSELRGVRTEVPLVAVGCGTGAPLDSVAVDNTAGAVEATRYLLDLGHPTVHYVSGPRTNLDARERAVGWRRALAAAGAPAPELVAGDWSSRSGYRAGQRLAERPGVTAVFCGNDQMALGLLRALAERGRRVPADVSVVGYDDIPEAGYFLPPLTTVRQDFAALGKRALRLLVDRIGGAVSQPGPQQPVVPKLVVRASAARPPKPGVRVGQLAETRHPGGGGQPGQNL
jgi:DNA-binding LacI/PurR family transcriptional regulator